MLPKLLFAAPDGTVFEHPHLRALARSGDVLLAPAEAPIPLPSGGRLVRLPGRRPVGLDPESGDAVPLHEVRVGKRRWVPDAVAAIFPPGYTRTLLPAAERRGGPPLTQWAYAAAGWGPRGPVGWALRTDRRAHWNPRRFSTPDLEGRIERLRAEAPDNRVLRQLERCAREYGCFTAQNIFYRRDEGGLPASTGCNARCAGCISERRRGGPPSSMERQREAPGAEELAEVGAAHLAHARGRVMVSFGQGCEGEPLTRSKALAAAVRSMRLKTARGSININTNASRPEALEALLDAGLDAVRISLNSAHPDLYAAYYRPVGYGFSDVEESFARARARGAYVAVNLLILPGVTDRLGEVELLCELLRRHRVDQVQARSLCIDADPYVELARGRGAGGPAVGVRAMLQRFRRAAPWLSIGNFARGLGER